MKKQFIVLALALLFVLPMICANTQTLGTYKQNTCVNLVQVCDNCSYVNLTTMQNPNSVITLSKLMHKNGETYNYTYCATNLIGKYIATTCGDLNTQVTCSSFDFYITPSGTEGGFTGTLGFYLILLAIISGLIALGFWIKDGWFVIFAGFGLIAIGIYSINSGVAGFKDMFIPWMIGLFEIGIGTYLAVNSALEMMDIELSAGPSPF